jgi:hypothetical protein
MYTVFEGGVDLTCTLFFQAVCASALCCPECGSQSDAYATCYSNLTAGQVPPIGYFNDCAVEDCGSLALVNLTESPTPEEQPTCFVDVGQPVSGNCTCHESCATCG